VNQSVSTGKNRISSPFCPYHEAGQLVYMLGEERVMAALERKLQRLHAHLAAP